MGNMAMRMEWKVMLMALTLGLVGLGCGKKAAKPEDGSTAIDSQETTTDAPPKAAIGPMDFASFIPEGYEPIDRVNGPAPMRG